MSLSLEYKKSKRTGCFLTFAAGGAAAAALPVINMAFRSEIYTTLKGSPVQILFNANWQMLAMMNVLLVALGACLLYHTEYADNAMQKMRTLPVKEGGMFTGKFVWITVMYLITLAAEAAGITFCICRWFSLDREAGTELLQSFSYSLLMTLPAISASLLIASICRNVWISLGINVVCVFTATMLPTDHFVLSLFPFALPFQIFTGTAKNTVCRLIIAASAETAVLSAAELIIIKIRRSFE